MRARDTDHLLSMNGNEFIRSAYLSILGRPVDPTGLRGLTKQLSLGTPKDQIVASLALSDEGKLAASTLPGLGNVVANASRHRSLLRRAVRRVIGFILRPVLEHLEGTDRLIASSAEANRTAIERLEAALCNGKFGPTAVAWAAAAAEESVLAPHAHHVLNQLHVARIQIAQRRQQ